MFCSYHQSSLLTDHVGGIRFGHIHPFSIPKPAKEDHSDGVEHADQGDDKGAVRLRVVESLQVFGDVEVRHNKPDEQQQHGQIKEGELGVEEQRKVKDGLDQVHKVVVPFLQGRTRDERGQHKNNYYHQCMLYTKGSTITLCQG